MLDRRVLAAFLLLCVAGCVPPAAPPAPPPPPPAPPVPSVAPVPAAAEIAPGVWHVERARCRDLLAASDDDRAAAVMFYYGYFAARSHVHVIDVSRIDPDIAIVMNTCAAAPQITIISAFAHALRSTRWR